ncbi:MAG: O-antigen ligase family protein [Chlamydiota bacterium]
MTTGSRAVDFPRISAWAVVIGVSALFVLVPLAWWPKDPYGLIKWVLVGAVAIVASSLRLAAFFSSGEASFRRNAINLPLALLLLWSCLSLWIGPDRYYVRGRLYELLLLALLYAAIVSSADSPARRLFLAAGALAGLSAICLLGIGHYAGLFSVQSPWGTGLGTRVYATMLNPNYLADFIVGLFPMALALFVWHAPGGRSRALLGAVAAVSFLCLLFTVSWGGWFGWSISVGVCVSLARGRCRLHAATRPLAALLALLFAALGVFLFANRHTVAADYTGMKTRSLYWRASWAMIREKPFVGHGLNSFQPYIPDHLTKIIAANFPDGVPEGGVTVYEGNFAHNEVLGTWIETGLIGLALLVVLLVRFFAQAARNLACGAGPRETALNVGAVCGVAAMLGQGMVSYPFRVPASTVSFALLLAFVGSGTASRSCRVSCAAVPPPVRALLALIALAAGLALLPLAARPLRGEVPYVEARYASYAGAWERVRARCREAFTYSVTEPEAYDLLGEAEERCGSTPGAIAAYQRKLELKPFDAHARTKLGILYDRLGMERESERHLRAAVALERHDSAEARVRLAESLARRGRDEEALRLLREGVRRHGSDWMLRNGLGIACAARGDRGGAEREFSAARARGGGEAAAYNLRLATGPRPPGTLPARESFIGLAGRDWIAERLRRGREARARGDMDRAREEFRAVQTRYPDFPAAASALGR